MGREELDRKWLQGSLDTGPCLEPIPRPHNGCEVLEMHLCNMICAGLRGNKADGFPSVHTSQGPVA